MSGKPKSRKVKGKPVRKSGKISKSAQSEFDAERFYRALLMPRLIEERMLLLLRQGRIAKWFSGIGQEAIAVGAALAAEPQDYIFPLIRNLGVFTTRGVPLERLLRQLFGKAGGFTKGRDRTFHFGTLEHKIIANPTLLVAQLPVAGGVALAQTLRGGNGVCLAFCGDGGTSQGDFHEALNVAAVWNLPVLFLVENNQYALSTPGSEQYKCKQLSDRAVGYGIEGRTIDGNDLLEVYRTVRELTQAMRKDPRPVLLECMTFRMRGHEEASGIKYVPPQLFKTWGKKDPLLRFEEHLDRKKSLSAARRSEIREQLLSEIVEHIEDALSAPEPQADLEQELKDVYAPVGRAETAESGTEQAERRFVDAVADGLRTALQTDENVIVMGQDIAEYGGVFKVTEGLSKDFGTKRVRNTPLCESGIIGLALGLSFEGYKPVLEMQFADFVTCGINQLFNNVSKNYYRWGQPADMVIRMPTGAGVGGGPYHSESCEAWFAHMPGLKIAYPAFPADAKGMLQSAIDDPNPVLFFEHKYLYRAVSGSVPKGLYRVPLGNAQVIPAGDSSAKPEFSVITYGLGVHWMLEYLKQHPEQSCRLLDLRSLAPLDYEAIAEAAAATGRVLVLHEARLTCGIGAEIAAWIAQHCFRELDAPVERCAGLDTPVPFAAALEEQFLAKCRLEECIQRLLSF